MQKELYKNLYKTQSIRLKDWDYRMNAAYFVTICTKDKAHYFGRIEDSKMIYSSMGIIADVLWCEIKNHNKNIELSDFIIMPNHIHGILILQNEYIDDEMMETGHALSLQKTIGKNRFQNIGKNSLSSIIGSYKSAVTKHTNRLGLEFAWQSRFYEHIIRNEQSFEKITNYILANPENWVNDELNL
ncbi:MULTISPECIES: transposase [Pasteurellaceae]|uniref:Transposase IS200-like domain-containing protein n=1 Tax=Pasteurella atlantica TaxID=2827233 RepID=A0AAW8CMF3_9PAST|nr:transposase [Pasteurella atlantica]MBR0573503.1 hypothetical protein [Pasteurella atlantica]MDP8039504.1 hypothetical protein [Pasteurella atlantica]MDP8041595.1 hypothetical protein [Pasteurella atlantica]MDP8043732.1 hypothetical protein [Pasteurella atlantica]MDP8045771.1 hypothetical protein [Pasteurella atlantica]